MIWDRVRLTTQRGGGNPQKQSQHRADNGGKYPDADAQRQTCKGTNQHIPSHPVGAEEMRQAGSNIFFGKVGLQGRAGQQKPGNGHAAQHQGRRTEQNSNPLTVVHDLAAPLRILGSTTP